MRVVPGNYRLMLSPVSGFTGETLLDEVYVAPENRLRKILFGSYAYAKNSHCQQEWGIAGEHQVHD